MVHMLKKFEIRIHEICGIMSRFCFSLPGQQSDLIEQAKKLDVPLTTTISRGSFDNSSSSVIHSATFEEQLKDLECGGKDEVFLGNMCTCFIYSLWEDEYREEFSKIKNCAKNKIKSDFFSELNKYRQAIIHNNSTGTSATSSLKILPRVKQGDPVHVDRHCFELIVNEAIRALHQLYIPNYVA